MKIKNIVLIGVAAAAMLTSFTSCLKDQEDVFDKPLSARMDEYLDNVQKLLTQPKYGWRMSFFPTEEMATNYAMKFTKDQVSIQHESIMPAEGWSNDCTYKLTTDDGAVLSFDTYSVALHYYSTPSSGAYQSYGGDFEFNIMSACADSIVLRGKRSRNTFTMYPLEEDGQSYLNKVLAMEERISMGALEGVVTNGNCRVELDHGTRTFTIYRLGAESADEIIEVPYIVTPYGFKLYEPTLFQGVTFSDFYINDDDTALTSSGVTFSMIIPEGYRKFADYPGEYTLTYSNGSKTADVELVQGEKKNLLLKGISKFDIVMGYNSGTGTLTMLSQQVGADADVAYWMCAWDTNEGYLTWGTSYGLIGKTKEGTDTLTFTMVDNGKWGSYTADSFIMWTMRNGSSAGQNANKDYYFTITGNSQLVGPLTFTKKN